MSDVRRSGSANDSANAVAAGIVARVGEDARSDTSGVELGDLRPERLPTIQDVARLAGVGKTTAADALQGRGRVASITRERVLAAAEHLGYRVHVGARDLGRRRTEVIGVVAGDFFDPFSGELVGRLEQYAAACGLRVLLSTAGSGLREVQPAIMSLLEHRVAAIVLVAFTDDRQVHDVVGKHIPIVRMRYEAPWGISIGLDEKLGGDLATAHLVDLGHTRIGYLSAALLPPQVDRDRLAGYRRALRRAGIRSAKSYVRRLPLVSEEQGQTLIREFLSQPERPTAVFAASDITAIEMMSCAYELGIEVPGDLSVVGYDDIMLARAAMISLTTVAQPAAELARRGIDAAVSLIENPQMPPQTVRIEPRLIVRKTTAPPR
jgi:LacI family transcriptional regulator